MGWEGRTLDLAVDRGNTTESSLIARARGLVGLLRHAKVLDAVQPQDAPTGLRPGPLPAEEEILSGEQAPIGVGLKVYGPPLVDQAQNPLVLHDGHDAPVHGSCSNRPRVAGPITC